MTGGEAVIASLAAHGVTTVFGIPGTHNLALFSVMQKHGIVNITTRHEQGAGYAADGYARSSGQIGVVITTTGPAALNAAAALAQANSDSVPTLLIAPGMPTGHPSRGNGLLHELRDQQGVFSSLVAESHRVESVAEIPVAVTQAFARMRSGRPRSEYLEVPLDLLETTEIVTLLDPLPVGLQSLPSDYDLSTAAAVLDSAKNVVIVAGGGAADADAEITAIAEKLYAPVVTTTNGKGTLSEDHWLSLGAGVQHRSVLDALEQADAVLAIGTEFAPSDWWLGVPKFGGTVIRIDIDESAVLTNVIPTHALIGDASSTLRLLTGLVSVRELTDKARLENLQRTVLTEHAKSGENWQAAYKSLNAVLPDDTIIAADNAMAAYYGALALLTLKHSRSYLFPSGGGTLGFGLPAGIGAKIANPDAAVVVIQGDGGIMFSIQELSTAAECGIALPIIVFDNGGYGEIHNEMADREDPIHSVALASPDFPALARSLGCIGVSVTNDEDLGSLVSDALAADRPTLIHVLENGKAARALLKN
jgi:thiamine pyrophosphate-dependent acetolactate synthase large subunit-like protein